MLNNANRRTFIKSTLAVGVGLSALGALVPARAAEDKDAVSMPGNVKPVTSEELFRMGVIGPAELSLAASQLGSEKATRADVKEFAGFELTEAVAVTSVLKELGTAVPAPDAKAKATLEKLKSAAKGSEFDKAFITTQLENHEFLRDHAMDYLKRNVGSKSGAADLQTQHLATLALATFKEHVAITQRISGELKA